MEEEDGEGGNGSIEVARWRFARRELRKAISGRSDHQLHVRPVLEVLLERFLASRNASKQQLDAPAEILKPGMRWVTAIAPLEVSWSNARGDG